jgi:hypothetical protein
VSRLDEPRTGPVELSTACSLKPVGHQRVSELWETTGIKRIGRAFDLAQQSQTGTIEEGSQVLAMQRVEGSIPSSALKSPAIWDFCFTIRQHESQMCPRNLRNGRREPHWATSVTFGGGASATFTVNGYAEVTTVPKGAKNGPIYVTTPGGTATSSQSFRVTKH